MSSPGQGADRFSRRLASASVALLAASAAAWTWLSFDFLYGEYLPQRPVLLFLVCYWAGWGAWLLALTQCFRGWRPSSRTIFLVAVGLRLVLLPSNLILENDVYRYVLDGQVLLSGENPYEYSPAELQLQTFHPLAEELQTPAAQKVLQRVGYPEIPTVYPPAAQLVFSLGSWLGGWNWFAMRVLFLLVDLTVVLLLIALLKRLSQPVWWAVLYAWNPLILKEVANSVHMDVLLALGLVGLLVALADFEKKESSLALFSAGFSLAGTILTKFYPVILVPSVSLFLRRRGLSWPAVVLFNLLVGAAVVLAYLPFARIGTERLFAGLQVFASQWTMNQGVYSLIDTVAPAQARLLAWLLPVLFGMLLAIWNPPANVRQLVEQMNWILLIWFLFLPAMFPWYALGLLAIASVALDRRWLGILVVLTAAVAVYYLHFWLLYHDLSESWWAIFRFFEHTAIWGAAAVSWFSLQPAKTDRLNPRP